MKKCKYLSYKMKINLEYIVVLITLKNIHCYNPKRHTQGSPNFKHLKGINSESVIPARYKISSKTNSDPVVTQNSATDYFPEVEYPSNIMESSKPFYLSSSPFPDDVKSSFQSLICDPKGKAKSTIDYYWRNTEYQNEKGKEKQLNTPPKVGVNEDTKEKYINSSDKGINETLYREPVILNFEDDTAHYGSRYLDNDMDKLFTILSSPEKSPECQEMDYVVRFINDMDKFMKNLTSIDSPGFIECNNSTIFESEFPNELISVNSDMTRNNNDSIIAFNGNFLRTEEQPELIRNPLFEEPYTTNAEASSSFISLFNEAIETSFVDFYNIGKIANETNSCTENLVLTSLF